MKKKKEEINLKKVLEREGRECEVWLTFWLIWEAASFADWDADFIVSLIFRLASTFWACSFTLPEICLAVVEIPSLVSISSTFVLTVWYVSLIWFEMLCSPFFFVRVKREFWFPLLKEFNYDQFQQPFRQHLDWECILKPTLMQSRKF